MSKTLVILEKVQQERSRGAYEKALKRLGDAISKRPDDLLLYKEAIDVSLEAGESLGAVDFFKRALKKQPHLHHELWQFAREAIRKYNDPIIGKFLFEQAIKQRNLELAGHVLDNLKEHTATEFLKRNRTKRQTLSGASGGGMNFAGELAVNSFGEALLCVRLKRFQEAAKSFLRIIDRKPVENEVIRNYFATLEPAYVEKGGISYALGCALLAGEHYQKGLAKIVEGVSKSTSLAKDATERLKVLDGNPDVSAEELKLSLASVSILNGDAHHAAEYIESVLEKNVGKVHLILNMLQPHVEEIGDTLILHYLYVESTLVANDTTRALGHLKKIYGMPEHRSDLMAWLDTKSQDRFLPVEVLTFQGKIALEQQMYEKAIEILRGVLFQSPQAKSDVRELLAKHKSNPGVGAFHKELDGNEPAAAKSGSGLDIEHFGHDDFSLHRYEEGTGKPAPPPVTPKAASDQSDDPIQIETDHLMAQAPRAFNQEAKPVEDVQAGQPADSTASSDTEMPDIGIEGIEIARPIFDSIKKDEPAETEPSPMAEQPADDTAGFERGTGGPAADIAPIELPDNTAAPAADDAASQPDEDTGMHFEEIPGKAPAPIDKESADETSGTMDDHDTEVVDIARDEEFTAETTVEDRSAETPAPETPGDSGDEADSPSVILLGVSDLPDEFETEDGDRGASDESAAGEQDEAPEPEAEMPQHEETGDAPEQAQPPVEYEAEAETAAQHETPASRATAEEAEAEKQVTSTNIDEPADEPADFDSRFAQFKSGRMSNQDCIELARTAATLSKLEELRALLEFRPDTVAQEVQRKFYLADYYMMKDRPLAGLVILKTVQLKGLSREERKAHLLKIAACYQELDRFDAAHSVYLRILSENPDFLDADKMAKLNYQRYLESVTNEAPVLEKVTIIS